MKLKLLRHDLNINRMTIFRWSNHVYVLKAPKRVFKLSCSRPVTNGSSRWVKPVPHWGSDVTRRGLFAGPDGWQLLLIRAELKVGAISWVWCSQLLHSRSVSFYQRFSSRVAQVCAELLKLFANLCCVWWWCFQVLSEACQTGGNEKIRCRCLKTVINCKNEQWNNRRDEILVILVCPNTLEHIKSGVYV